MPALEQGQGGGGEPGGTWQLGTPAPWEASLVTGGPRAAPKMPSCAWVSPRGLRSSRPPRTACCSTPEALALWGHSPEPAKGARPLVSTPGGPRAPSRAVPKSHSSFDTFPIFKARSVSP